MAYDPGFVSRRDRAEIVAWLATIQPLWENRFTERAAAAAGGQRRLLRPVYWLGSWQFACLDYYRPPHGVADRCVEAEPYPAVLARLVDEIEKRARRAYRGPDLPPGWRLNTCLVNLYGDRLEGGKRIDCARVGEHRDFEPGPVASISLGERALFQFVRRGGRESPARVLHQRWLEDGSLLLFGGEPWKTRALHRVLRVERRGGARFALRPAEFETRRVNFTFRFVPPEHIVRYAELGAQARADVRRYVAELALASPFFAAALSAAPAQDGPEPL
jgi:alkylated DNA repair protein (DNA oxidative demethylase)